MLSSRLLSPSARFYLKTRAIASRKSNMSTESNGNANGENGENKVPLLALPATAEETVQQVGMNDTYKLKELGPVGKFNHKKNPHLFLAQKNDKLFRATVVNEDGTLSRISNWHEMADIEKSNVNRILLKRNRERLERLKKQREEAQQQ